MGGWRDRGMICVQRPPPLVVVSNNSTLKCGEMGRDSNPRTRTMVAFEKTRPRTF